MSTLLEALRRIETRNPPVAQPPASSTGAPPSPHDATPPSPPRDVTPPSPRDAMPPSPRDAMPSSSADVVLPASPGAVRPSTPDETPIAALEARPNPRELESADAAPALAVAAGAASPVEAAPTRADRRVARQMLQQIGDGAGAVVLWLPVEPLSGLDGCARRVAAALGETLGADVAVWSGARGSAGMVECRRSAPGAQCDRPSPAELRRSCRAALVVGEPADRWAFEPFLGEYDGVYLIVELGTTTRRAAADAAARARAAGGRLLGCIAVVPAECEAPQGTAP